MAKIGAMPGIDIISGFRGVIDYYVNYQSCNREVAGKGIPCVRKWPVMHLADRAPSVKAGWLAFATASRLWSQLSPAVQAAYNQQAGRGGLCGRDVFTRGYIGGLYRYPIGP